MINIGLLVMLVMFYNVVHNITAISCEALSQRGLLCLLLASGLLHGVLRRCYEILSKCYSTTIDTSTLC